MKDDNQLNELFRTQLRDETERAPAFDQLWSQAAASHHRARTRRMLLCTLAALLVVAFAARSFWANDNALVKSSASTQPAPAVNPSKSADFRAPPISLNTGESAIQKPSASTLEELLDRRDTLEREVRIGKSKIETNRKRVDVLKALGKTEEVDRLTNETRDWETRIRESRNQVARVEDEIDKAQHNSPAQPVAVNAADVFLPGNSLELWVNEDASFNGRYAVRRGGYIMLPQIGRVVLAGKTVAQAEAAIKKAIDATQPRRVTVKIERLDDPANDQGPLIYLSGEFNNPRPYRIPPGTAPTLVSLLLNSGGWTGKADVTRVKVMRMAGGRSFTEEVDVAKILTGTTGIPGDIMLTEGDVIVLQRSGDASKIHVTGRVKTPGSYSVSEGEKLTTHGAILKSGGFDSFSDQQRVHILRAMPDGTKSKLPVNIKEVISGKRPDKILQAGDTVVVPEKWFNW